MRYKKESASRNVLVFMLFMLLGVFGNVFTAFAQVNEAEPNNACSLPQNLGVTSSPLIVQGSLDSSSGLPNGDVDFFRFTGAPGDQIKVTLEGLTNGKGTLSDPYLGAFDSSCNFIASNDDFNSLDSALNLTIPADGVVILAATSCCDSSFSGNGASLGTYQLTVTSPAVVRSISGHIIDGVTGNALSGSGQPFGYARLQRCEQSECFDVNSQAADINGQFRFTATAFGQPLDVGLYKVIAFANEYIQNQTSLFSVTVGENRNIGNIALQPFPIRISEIRPCGNLPAEGGGCAYSARVTNRSASAVDVAAWSVVSSNGIGSFINSTTFQTADPQWLKIAAGGSKVVQFSFTVPSGITNGTSICTQLFVGDSRKAPFFNTIGQQGLFCISKGATGGFSAVSQKEAQKTFRRLNGQVSNNR